MPTEGSQENNGAAALNTAASAASDNIPEDVPHRSRFGQSRVSNTAYETALLEDDSERSGSAGGDASDSDSCSVDSYNSNSSSNNSKYKYVHAKSGGTAVPAVTVWRMENMDDGSFYAYCLIHVLCIAMYLLPIVTVSTHNKGMPVLDELHIMSPDNYDIYHPNVTLSDIFSHDYWGRPMNSPSSHKSWRPLTVLTFRYLSGIVSNTINNNMQASSSSSSSPQNWFFSALQWHRLFNVITHAATAELVGCLAVKLLLPHTYEHAMLLRTLAKLVFVLHPTHVEVTANAANRNHLLAVLCSVLLSDVDLPWFLFVPVLLAGYLCSETFLFQIVPCILTFTTMAYLRRYHGPNQVYKRPKGYWKQLVPLFPMILPRLILFVSSALFYVGARWALDTLSIPDGLIRPAENPFFTLKGYNRIRNYAYVLAIHIGKSWDVDWIGASHEYGYNCIPEITAWTDTRLLVPAAMIVLLMVTAVYFLYWQQKRRTVLSIAGCVYLVHVSWMTTLLPISGIIKVGTFVADRIVVASTVSVSIVLASVTSQWILHRPRRHPHYYTTNTSSNSNSTTPSSSSNSSATTTSTTTSFTTSTSTSTTNTLSLSSLSSEQQQVQAQVQAQAAAAQAQAQAQARRAAEQLQWQYQYQRTKRWKLLALLILGLFMWKRIIVRTLEWMDSVPLLERSLRTCPNFAKGHLEYSKIYSGLYPSKFNLTTARYHLQTAERIDPNYCDVHQQFAHVAIQEGKFLEFEQRLTNSLLCPYTMGGQLELWKRYWNMALSTQSNPPEIVAAAEKRYHAAMSVLQTAMASQEEQAAQQRATGASYPYQPPSSQQQQQQQQAAPGKNWNSEL